LSRAGFSKLICPYTTVCGPDILRNAFISGYITFCQINTYVLRIFIPFSLLTKCLRGPDEMSSRAAFGPSGCSLESHAPKGNIKGTTSILLRVQSFLMAESARVFFEVCSGFRFITHETMASCALLVQCVLN